LSNVAKFVAVTQTQRRSIKMQYVCTTLRILSCSYSSAVAVKLKVKC